MEYCFKEIEASCGSEVNVHRPVYIEADISHLDLCAVECMAPKTKRRAPL